MFNDAHKTRVSAVLTSLLLHSQGTNECKSIPLSYTNSGDIFIYNSNPISETSQLFIPIFKQKLKVMLTLSTLACYKDRCASQKGLCLSGYLPEKAMPGWSIWTIKSWLRHRKGDLVPVSETENNHEKQKKQLKHNT